MNPQEKSRTSPLIEAARQVLRREAEGIAAVEASLGAEFLELVERLTAIRGRVIVSGNPGLNRYAGLFRSSIGSQPR
jgi:hypothetical protein